MVELVSTATEFELSPTLAANELVVKRRGEGKDVLHMGFGQSSFPVPQKIQDALAQYANHNEYLPTSGLPALCETVGKYYEERIGLDLDKFDVFVAPGSKLILYSLQMAIEGDLLMPVPSWVSYAPQAKMLRTQITKVPTTLDDQGYHISADDLRSAIHSARAEGKNPSKIILNYPNNPTGLTIPEDELKAIAEVCVEEDIFIISDEIYGFVSFDEQYRTISKYAPTHTAVTTGLSKHFSIGGWRVGVGFIPKAVDGLFDLLCNIASETWSCVAAPVQYTVMKAYEGDPDVEKHVKDCAIVHGHMNQYIAAGLRDLGLHAPAPQGAFYNYPNFDVFREDLAKAGVTTSKELADHLMHEYGLISLPGTAFGADPDVLTLRLSGCDYDGAEVLGAYQSGEALDEAFIAKNAPRVKQAVETFGQFLSDVKGQAQAA